ncbi:MAG TPA: beta-galactosidase [Anaerolineales bacterium]|nr:beta-galactosidase [Anaerolineales bacterium]
MFPNLLYGGDYNPEQWSEEVWQEDARLMQEAGVNQVSLGIFAWAKLEPAPGQYDFAWLDRIMDLLHAHQVRVTLATPTASPPPWLVRLHPEILPVTADGLTLWQGSRRHYCPHRSAYREHAVSIVTQLARHVQKHPALSLWHVDNEYACHLAECFCEASAVAFRIWLEQRYQSLEALNDAWGTAFWSQHYSDWQEIAPPRRAPTFINPTQLLDWQRFTSDSWLSCFEDQIAILRELTPEVPVTTNFMGFFKPLDYWKWSRREDIVSNDSYPDPSDPRSKIDAAMACDLMRSLKNGQPWLLMEQASSQVNWRPRNAPKPPGAMRLGSVQALARGADGIMFFQWRASLAGAEKFHSGMLPHAGTGSRVWREIKGLGAELRKIDELRSSRVEAEVAILFDWENWWALELPGKPSIDLQLYPLLQTLYAEFYRRNITVDFAPPDADLSRYRLIIAPSLYLVSDAAMQNLERYVARGGTLLMTYFSGIVDPNEHIRPGGYPEPLRRLFGLWIEEFAAYAEGQTNLVETSDGQQFTCHMWSDVIRPTGAEVLASYRSGYFAKSPAITRQPFRSGVSYYLGTSLESNGLAWLLEHVCEDAGIKSVDLPAGVEITRRTNGAQTWLFVLNHSDTEVQIDLDRAQFDLISDTEVGGKLSLKAKDVAILRL